MFGRRKSPGITLLEVHEVASSVVDLVRASEEHLWLISPYFQPWRHLTDAIAEVVAAGVSVDFLVRTDQVAKARGHFRRLGLEPRALRKLHAKMYLNEHEALLTSMNLYDGSRESREFGVHIDRAKQPVLYEACHAQALDNFEKGEPCEMGVKKASRKKRASTEHDKPLSPSAYKSLRLWRREKSVPKVAATRGIKESTVYSHLAAAIGEGWIPVEDVVNPTNRKAIQVGLREVGPKASLSALVHATPRKVTYGEAACLLAAWEAHKKTLTS